MVKFRKIFSKSDVSGDTSTFLLLLGCVCIFLTVGNEQTRQVILIDVAATILRAQQC